MHAGSGCSCPTRRRYHILSFPSDQRANDALIAFTYTKLNKNDSALLIVDLQVGLAASVRDWDATIFKNNLLGHAGIGRVYGLPVIMTTSVEGGQCLDCSNSSPLVLRMLTSTRTKRTSAQGNPRDVPN